MMKQLNSIILGGLFCLLGCRQVTSEVQVEQVNPALVNEIIQKADSSISFESGNATRALNPFFISGKTLYYSKSDKTTTLWFDEQGNVSGMVETQSGITKDSIQFYPNGQRMFTIIFNSDGLPEGPAKYFYPDGRISKDGRFKTGKTNGIWRIFDQNGKLVKTVEYDSFGNPKR